MNHWSALTVIALAALVSMMGMRWIEAWETVRYVEATADQVVIQIQPPPAKKSTGCYSI